MVVISMFVLSYALYNTKTEMVTLVDNYKALAEKSQMDNVELVGIIDQQNKFDEAAFTNDYNLASQLDMISWALDTNFQFDYNEEPLNESNINQLINLIYRLDDNGFVGAIFLNVHFGDVCVDTNEFGELAQANGDTSLSECELLSTLNEDFNERDLLSAEYLRFEKSVVPVANGTIKIQIHSHGTSAPRGVYPEITSDLTAKDWNKIALKNNRISVSFQQDSSSK